MTDLNRAEFLAFIPPLQSAIRTGGDGGRVTLEVPETSMSGFAKLLGIRGKRLKVTVEILTELDDAPKKTAKGGGDQVGRRRIRNR